MLFTKIGSKFGGVGGGAFDDSLMHNFTCSHYLRGMVAQRGFYPSNWFQFLYSSPSSPDQIIKGNIHGSRSKDDIPETFILNNDERIYKIQVVYENTSYYKNKIKKIARAVRGIRLFTTKGRSSPPLDHKTGTKVTEEFIGYTVSYVSGKSGIYLDQIQFHWFRPEACL
jgi:hypothetical protein